MQEIAEGQESESNRFFHAVGAFLHIGGTVLLGFSLLGAIAFLFLGERDRAGIAAIAAMCGLVAALMRTWGISLRRTGFPFGLRSRFRRASTIRSQMTLIAVVAVLLALFVEAPLVLIGAFGFIILFWPILLWTYAEVRGCFPGSSRRVD
jgi:hypothetical protein